MVHRDLKPANILLPGLERPVLSDFGIARLLGETGLTASGAMIGTPAYMSPEQGRGERGDARSDIYSLGIVLYEMLTGRPPYDADTPYAIILKHINDPLTPPHALIDPMPEAVERVVLKCLAKEAADRYASMVALREALHEAQRAIGLQKTTSTIAAAAPTLAPIVPQPETVKPAEPISAVAPAARAAGQPVWLIGGVVSASDHDRRYRLHCGRPPETPAAHPGAVNTAANARHINPVAPAPEANTDNAPANAECYADRRGYTVSAERTQPRMFLRPEDVPTTRADGPRAGGVGSLWRLDRPRLIWRRWRQPDDQRCIWRGLLHLRSKNHDLPKVS
jgi:hypothetical protein